MINTKTDEKLLQGILRREILAKENVDEVRTVPEEGSLRKVALFTLMQSRNCTGGDARGGDREGEKGGGAGPGGGGGDSTFPELLPIESHRLWKTGGGKTGMGGYSATRIIQPS